MHKQLIPFAKAFGSAGLLSVSLAACVGGGTSSSSETTASSETAMSSEMSSAMESSSSMAPSSSSEAAVSSSSVMSSSSMPVASSSEAAADCSTVDVMDGKTAFLADCTNCHNDYDQGSGLFTKQISFAPDIDPNNIVNGGNLGLADYIAAEMAKCEGDAACEEKSQQIANYINSFSSNTEWCEGLVDVTSSSSAPMSSSSEAEVSSSSVASNGENVVVYAINAGARASYTATDGTVYQPDLGASYVTGGMGGSTMDPIDNTEDDTLYQTERYGTFSYSLPLAAATYDVTLHMIEAWHGVNPGNREFDVEIEGQILVNDFDPLATAGHDVAHDIQLNGIEVSDGTLDITFTPSMPEANVAAITVKGPESSVPDDNGNNGSGGNETDADRSCTDDSGLLICLDFEDVAPGATPAGFTKAGNVNVVDGQEAFTGTRALKLSGSGELRISNFPGSHWGRLYYKNTAKPNSIGNYSHTTFVKGLSGGAQFRFVDMVAAPVGSADDGFYQHLYNTEPNDLSLEGPYVNQYDGEWVCVEWSMNATTQEYHFFQDGIEVALANGGTPTNKTNLSQAVKYDGSMHPMTPVPGTLDTFSIGIQNYQNHQYEFFMDDIAVGAERIGCDIM
ncbi:malectin domain-containing carbohydrate-binding protein [Marinagarivorans cellulosilyticus]|uniref:Cytochrome c domain-containing protein n=1 Tax=Marinagarivorans cellulosilyticus TaxID=2721545 RepID=A0AAN1WIX0_9GAMM|nr:malectin domain-containing carbohydrate-binding protein [Marinagarivorans cellulosilyticus]BCD98428.1 hypothetical protein MARGE09_P2629 [Marinagarivorans cellulosilyticus]